MPSRTETPKAPAYCRVVIKARGSVNAIARGGKKAIDEIIIFPEFVFGILNPSETKSERLIATPRNDVTITKNAKKLAVREIHGFPNIC